MKTPWGDSQHIDRIGDKGILFVSTAGHGGIYLPESLRQVLPTELAGENTYSRSRNWYEEDVEWAIPVLAFPNEFTPAYCDAAVRTVDGYANKGRGEYFYNVAQWLATSAGDAVKNRAKLK